MAARIESRMARSSRPCSAAVRLPTSRIGCIRALHRISSVATGDIDDAARRTILAEYETHYNGRRPHRSRQLRPPRPDHPAADPSRKLIQRQPILGGLISEYERAA
jgi:hypothetical protein